MADIYTPDWYEQIRGALNARAATLREVPKGAWTGMVEIVGDGASPYVAEGAERHVLVRIEDGTCAWYREEQPGHDSGVELDYRFRGPATTFEEIAAGVIDPIDAVLKGTIKVRGDMRFLMRHAELVQALLEAYVSGVETSWPLGRPPYVPAERAHA